MARALTIMSIVIAILLLLVFAADLVIGIPFHGRFKMMDIIFILSAIGLGYISWSTLRDLR